MVCREMLARNQMIVGNYYYKRANFRAAESRFAELLQKYPETPVAPGRAVRAGISLEKEGKRYSAAQAFAAVKKHFPDTGYAKRAQTELTKLHRANRYRRRSATAGARRNRLRWNARRRQRGQIVVRQRSDSKGGTALASAGGFDQHTDLTVCRFSTRRQSAGAQSPQDVPT